MLNDTAFFIWEALESSFSFDELLYMLKDVFKGDPSAMEADLRDTIALFLKHHLIDEAP